jgi:hypothetical protein
MGHGHLDAWGARGRFFTMPAVFDVTEFVAAVAVGLVAVVTAFGAGLDSVAARDLDDRRVDPRAGRALRAGNERFELASRSAAVASRLVAVIAAFARFDHVIAAHALGAGRVGTVRTTMITGAKATVQTTVCVRGVTLLVPGADAVAAVGQAARAGRGTDVARFHDAACRAAVAALRCAGGTGALVVCGAGLAGLRATGAVFPIVALLVGSPDPVATNRDNTDRRLAGAEVVRVDLAVGAADRRHGAGITGLTGLQIAVATTGQTDTVICFRADEAVLHDTQVVVAAAAAPVAVAFFAVFDDAVSTDSRGQGRDEGFASLCAGRVAVALTGDPRVTDFSRLELAVSADDGAGADADSA